MEDKPEPTTEEKAVNAVVWGLCGYVATTVLSFFGVLFIGQLISDPDGFSQEVARWPALFYAPFLGITGFVIGCVVGAKRAGHQKCAAVRLSEQAGAFLNKRN